MEIREAINEILINVNELPLDDTDIIEDINIAVIINTFLTISRKQILKMGWYFNELTMTLVPNTNNYIVIPKTYLSVDSVTDSEQLIVRDWKLFDKQTLSFEFTEPKECNIIEDIVFDDIPFTIADYIVKSATLMAYSNIIGDVNGINIRAQALQQAKIEAIRDSANKIDGNLMDDEFVTTTLDRTSL